MIWESHQLTWRDKLTVQYVMNHNLWYWTNDLFNPGIQSQTGTNWRDFRALTVISSAIYNLSMSKLHNLSVDRCNGNCLFSWRVISFLLYFDKGREVKLRNNIIKSQPFYIQSNHLEAKLEQVITFSIVLDKNLCLLCVEILCLVSREHSEIASDRLSVRVGRSNLDRTQKWPWILLKI